MNFYLSNKKQVEIEFKDIVYHDIKIMKCVGANLVKKTWKTCTVDPWATCYPSPVEHLHTTLQLVLCIHDSLSVGSAKADCVSQLSRSVVSDSATPWTAARQASLSITNSRSPPKPCPLSRWCHLILSRPLLPLPSIFPSIRVFSNESALHIRWPEYWSFNFNISPSNEHLGLISFRIGWLDLLAVQGTLRSLLQHHSSKA